MLVLKRRENQSIVITCPDGTEAVITVLSIEGYAVSPGSVLRPSVRLGIEAPKAVRVMRAEVAREVPREIPLYVRNAAYDRAWARSGGGISFDDAYAEELKKAEQERR